MKKLKATSQWIQIKKDSVFEIWVRFWRNAGWGFRIQRIDGKKIGASSLAGFKNQEDAIKGADQTIEQKSCYLTC